MTDRQSIWYKMFLVVITYLESVTADITKPAIIMITLTKFKEKVKAIDDLQSGKGEISSGKVTIKNTLRDKLEALAFHLSSVIHSYAIVNDNAQLKESTETNESVLDKMRDDALYSKAIEVYKLAVPLTAALDDYDETPEEIEEVQSTAEQFKKALGDAGSSGTQSTDATANLADLYKEALVILENELDKHILPLKKKKPVIVAGYFAARKLVITGVRHDKKDDGTPPADPNPPQ